MARSGPSHRTLILLVALSITLITFSFRGNGATDSVREGVGGALSPIGDAVDWVLSPLHNAWDGAFDYDELAAENERLRNELAAVDVDALAIKALENDRDELAEMLRLDTSIDLPTVTARGTASPPQRGSSRCPQPAAHRRNPRSPGTPPSHGESGTRPALSGATPPTL